MKNTSFLDWKLSKRYLSNFFFAPCITTLTLLLVAQSVFAQNEFDFLLQTGTKMGETDERYEMAVGDFNGDKKPDLYVIKKKETGSKKTEVHILDGASNYSKFLLQKGTAMGETDERYEMAVGDFNGDKKPDLYVIKKKETGSKKTEVHILDGASNYSKFLLQKGTAMGETDERYEMAVGDFNGDKKPDLYVIKKKETGSKKTEVHILDGASNYSKFLLQKGTAMGETDERYEMAVGDFNGDKKPDLYVIKKKETGSKKTEVHILDGASNYSKFLLQKGTAIGETDDRYDVVVADYNTNGIPDVYMIKKNGTGSKKTEVHILGSRFVKSAPKPKPLNTSINGPLTLKGFQHLGLTIPNQKKVNNALIVLHEGFNEWKMLPNGAIVLKDNPKLGLAVRNQEIKNSAEIILHEGYNLWKMLGDGAIVLKDNPKFGLTVHGQLAENGTKLVLHEGFNVWRTEAKPAPFIPDWLKDTRPLRIEFFNESGYVAKYSVHYNGKEQWTSGNTPLKVTKHTTIPANAKNVRIVGKASYLAGWKHIFDMPIELLGADYCIKTYGTVFDPKYNNNCTHWNPFANSTVHVANHTGENLYIGWTTEVKWSLTNITTGVINGLIVANAHNMNANYYKYIALAAATDTELPKSAYELFKKAAIKIEGGKHKEVVNHSPLNTVKTFFDIRNGPLEFVGNLIEETAEQSDEYKAKLIEFNPILFAAGAFGAETLTIMVVNEDLTKFWIINTGIDDSWIVKTDKIVKAKYGTINQVETNGKSVKQVPLAISD